MLKIIQNMTELATTNLRHDALAIAEAGYLAINTKELIRRTVHMQGNQLCIGEEICQLDKNGVMPERIFFVGVGKCASVAAVAIEEALGDKLTSGIILDVSVSETCQSELKKIKCYAGTHPFPSEKNIDATKHILDLLHGLTEHDAVLVLVSGGGSTLLCQPSGAMVCADEKLLFQELTANGADIYELNTVRKHLSIARGGGLAFAAYPAQVIGLVISDVPGNDLSFIASGPTVHDETTIGDARVVLEKYNIDTKVIADSLVETPKEEKYFARVTTILLASNMTALDAMKKEAEQRGYVAHIVSSRMSGEAQNVAKDIAERLNAATPRSALLYGGETVVTARKGETLHNDGGRNQEVAIASLNYLHEDELVLPFASDGHDNGPVAGAIADSETMRAVQEKGASIADALRTHNTDSFFSLLNNHVIRTGDTGSNISDLLIGLKG